MTKLLFLSDFSQIQNELQPKKSFEYLYFSWIFFYLVHFFCMQHAQGVFFFFSQLTHDLSLTRSDTHLVTPSCPLQKSFLPFDSECFISIGQIYFSLWET